jgi:hypothetical protein
MEWKRRKYCVKGEIGRLIELTSAAGSGLTYVKVGDQYIFSKIALDKWLETVRLEIK